MHASTRLPRLFALTLLAGAAGCNVLGAVAYKVSQDPEIPAKFILDKEMPTVILVENFRSPDLSANDAELLGRTLQTKLEEAKVCKLIKTEKILDLRNNRPKDYGKMTIPEIGKAVGAEQVIYIDLQGSQITSLTGSSLFQAKAAAAVKVVDVKSGKSIYPIESVEGIGVQYETDALKGHKDGSYAQVRTALFDGLARQIGHHFYPWKQDEEDEAKER